MHWTLSAISWSVCVVPNRTHAPTGQRIRCGTAAAGGEINSSYAEKFRVRYVLQMTNLLSNAAKFSRAGGEVWILSYPPADRS
jgi:hypothetical protein